MGEGGGGEGACLEFCECNLKRTVKYANIALNRCPEIIHTNFKIYVRSVCSCIHSASVHTCVRDPPICVCVRFLIFLSVAVLGNFRRTSPIDLLIPLINCSFCLRLCFFSIQFLPLNPFCILPLVKTRSRKRDDCDLHLNPVEWWACSGCLSDVRLGSRSKGTPERSEHSESKGVSIASRI